MGFVRRKIGLEEYFDSVHVTWEHLSDAEYKQVLASLNKLIDSRNYVEFTSDQAFELLLEKAPIDGYIFSAPAHKVFSIYEEGGENLTFGYIVKGLESLKREELNQIECVVSNKDLSFAYVFNHEWQSMCPELLIEKNV